MKILEGYEGWEDGEELILWPTVLKEMRAGNIPAGHEAEWVLDNFEKLDREEFFEWAYEF